MTYVPLEGGLVGIETLIWLASVLVMCFMVLGASALLAILYVKFSTTVRRMMIRQPFLSVEEDEELTRKMTTTTTSTTSTTMPTKEKSTSSKTPSKSKDVKTSKIKPKSDKD